MSFKKFEQKDVLLNTMKAHPQSEFFIYNSTVYYNNMPEHSGAFSAQVRNVPPGFISLYEYNIDKKSQNSAGAGAGNTNNYIYPFITKDSARSSFKTAGKTSYNNEFAYGDILFSHYPMSASITREWMEATGGVLIDDGTCDSETNPPDEAQLTKPLYRHYYALKNRLNFYGLRSVHYKVIGTSSVNPTMPWNKDDQDINLISIHLIFY